MLTINPISAEMPPGYVLGADGCVPAAVNYSDYCCPPPLCGNDLCCTFVAFFNLLPSGPLWDYWKKSAISYFETSDDPAECPLLQDSACPSLILHAIYTVMKLRAMVHNALWPAFRESNPYTAVTTLDDHLHRLQWEDCYNQHCRTVIGSEITPLEIWSECGPLFCPPNYPPELEAALKKNIAVALTRANMGIIKNVCGINWVIEPLGAAITPIYPPGPPAPVPPYDPANPCASPACTDDVSFSLCYTGDTFDGVGSGDVCEANKPSPPVQAYWDQACDRPAGLPARVWPGVLAAECIVKSMLPYKCPAIPIIRCC